MKTRNILCTKVDFLGSFAIVCSAINCVQLAVLYSARHFLPLFVGHQWILLSPLQSERLCFISAGIAWPFITPVQKPTNLHYLVGHIMTHTSSNIINHFTTSCFPSFFLQSFFSILSSFFACLFSKYVFSFHSTYDILLVVIPLLLRASQNFLSCTGICSTSQESARRLK